MKKIYSISLGLLLTISSYAQAPQKMSYQAVIRNNINALVVAKQVGMKISILRGSASGTVSYSETQTPTTNANGLVSLEIGTGTIVSGKFDTIMWSGGNYFIKTETDPAGGTSYTISGTSQLLSVPYAFHSKSAENVTGPLNEKDPIYKASAAAGITSTDITKWNTAFVEKDPIYSASLASSIKSADTAKWNSTVATSMMLYKTGTSNANVMVAQHSPAFPTWGLQYNDTFDIFRFLSGGTKVLDVDLGSLKVTIPKNLNITGGTPGTDKVLTSDASGNATWSDFTTKVSAFLPAGCKTLASVTTSFQKVGDMGTFSKSIAGSMIELTVQTSLWTETLTGSTGSIYEIRVDGVATTIGTASALIRDASAHRFTSITGVFTGLAAGTHTVSMWAKCVFGSAANATFDAGCFNSFGVNNVLVKEFR